MVLIKEQIVNYILFLLIGVILGIIFPILKIDQLSFIIGCAVSYFVIIAVLENKQNVKR